MCFTRNHQVSVINFATEAFYKHIPYPLKVMLIKTQQNESQLKSYTRGIN